MKQTEPRQMDWKLLSSNYLYKDGWFTARRDRCEMPSGKIVDPYYVLEYPNWVNAVALTASDEILLIRQYRHALSRTILEIPGGCMDPGDKSPADAMRRELMEETGYAFDTLEPLGEVSPNPSTNTNLTYMFLATGGRRVGAQDLDPNEEIEILTFQPADVMKLLEDNAIVQSLHATCLFYAFIRLGWLKNTLAAR